MKRLRLKTIGKSDVRLMNQVFSKNGRVSFQLNKKEYELFFLPVEKKFAPEAGFLINVDGNRLWLGVEKVFFIDWMENLLGGEKITELPGEIREAAFEAVFEELLEGFEDWSGSKAAILEVNFDSPPENMGNNLFFRLSRVGANQGVTGQLSLDSAALEWLAGILERIPDIPGRDLDHLPVGARVEIGKTRLSIGDLKTVARHDIVLLDECWIGGGADVVVRFSPTLLFKGSVEGEAVVVKERMEDKMSDEDVEQETTGQPIDASSIEELPIELVFELGEKKIPLKDLMALQPGYTFDLEKSVEKPVSIRANGKIVGFGQLVQVDDHIGVRVLDLFELSDDATA